MEIREQYLMLIIFFVIFYRPKSTIGNLQTGDTSDDDDGEDEDTVYECPGLAAVICFNTYFYIYVL